MQRRRIIVYGGSFDPVHAGHITAAKYAAKNMARVGQLWFLPSVNEPGKKLVAFHHRVAMLSLAMKAEELPPIFKICTYAGEMSDNPSTYVMLNRIKALHPESDVLFMLGTDQAYDIRYWRNSRKLIREHTLVLVKRNPHAKAPSWVKKHDHIYLRRIQPVSISSMSLRTSMKDLVNKKFDDMSFLERSRYKNLHKPVIDYIKREGLYNA